MEEIDNIIIDSLKHIECNIDSNVESLKQFDPDMVTEAVSSCLETILTGQKFPKKLPASMSARLKIASNLADQIKELGFRGDMGYQSILYCNEVEIRRVLMFLIERLPRDVNKTIQIEQTGYVPKLVKKIEENIKLSMKQLWLPSSIFPKGIRECEDSLLVHSFGNCGPLNSVNLHIPSTSNNDNDVLKEYWIHDLVDVTKQCDPQDLVASLIFNDVRHKPLIGAVSPRSQKPTDIVSTVSDNLKVLSEEKLNLPSDEDKVETKISESEIKLQNLVRDLEDSKNEYLTLQEEVNHLELDLAQVISMKNQEQNILKDTAARVKLKTKTRAIINKEENLLKLKTLVDNGNERLVDLANQWNEVKTPLLEEYKSLQNSLSSDEIKLQEDEEKLNNLKEIYKALVKDGKEKEDMETSLVEKLAQVNKNNTRSAYTRRILEIIGNIKKQSIEIQKVLKDTKDVQKEINNLTGQVERSFTLSDELIFQDAKDDETARKAYKLLAALRDECNSILNAVEELGQVERESRNLHEQVEMEKAKDITAKLQRVSQDLEQMKRETDLLLRKNGH